MTDTPWIKASASGQESACVEMRRHDGMIEVRDTKNQGQGPTLRFTGAECAAWLDGERKGVFDRLSQ